MPAPDRQEIVAQPPSGAPVRAPLPDGLLCPDCAYDLRGLTSDQCPECGFNLAPLRRQESLLPWRRRTEIGRFRGFWLTLWVVSAHPRRLAIEVVAQQPLSEARRFWLIVWLHLTLVFLLGVTGAAVSIITAVRTLFTETNAWLLGGLAFVFPVWLWQLPGLATYLLQTHRVPEEHERRSAVLSIYVWAILIWALPSIISFMIAGIVSAQRGTGAIGPSFAAVGLCLLTPPVVFMQRRLYVVCRRLLHLGRFAAAWRIVCIQLAAVALFAVLILFPLGVWYLAVIGASLE